jgi:hypothetical protein
VASLISNLVADPGGWFVYASSASGIYGFQVNRAAGELFAIPGSPFPLTKTLTNGEPPPTITMDPTGNFIYLAYIDGTLASYRVHRSEGNLTTTGWAHTFGNGGCQGITGLTTSVTGQYIYLTGAVLTGEYGYCSTYIYGLQADPNHAFLNNSVPGSPYDITNVLGTASQPVSTGSFLYLIGGGSGDEETMLGYSISSSTGALTAVSGTPFTFPNFPNPSPSFFADWKMRFLWAFDTTFDDSQWPLQAFGTNSANGELSVAGTTYGFQNEGNFDLAEDHTGQFAFVSLDPYEHQTPPDVPMVGSWTIKSDGSFSQLNSVTVSTVYGDAITSMAVVTKNPQ